MKSEFIVHGKHGRELMKGVTKRMKGERPYTSVKHLKTRSVYSLSNAVCTYKTKCKQFGQAVRATWTDLTKKNPRLGPTCPCEVRECKCSVRLPSQKSSPRRLRGGETESKFWFKGQTIYATPDQAVLPLLFAKSGKQVNCVTFTLGGHATNGFVCDAATTFQDVFTFTGKRPSSGERVMVENIIRPCDKRCEYQFPALKIDPGTTAQMECGPDCMEQKRKFDERQEKRRQKEMEIMRKERAGRAGTASGRAADILKQFEDEAFDKRHGKAGVEHTRRGPTIGALVIATGVEEDEELPWEEDEASGDVASMSDAAFKAIEKQAGRAAQVRNSQRRLQDITKKRLLKKRVTKKMTEISDKHAEERAKGLFGLSWLPLDGGARPKSPRRCKRKK